MSVENESSSTLLGGRYLLGEPFASGGMGTLHLGRAIGAGGFSRVVAVKRLFPYLAADKSFRQMLVDEARFASRIRHPNVVPMLDVVEQGADIYVVMEYVHGVSLSQLIERLEGAPLPVPVAVGIAEAVLHGLHAAHEARGEDGEPLGIVHRDVSPQNVLVGADGVARLIDFGIAQAATRFQITDPGVIKGKAGYMAPEQLLRESVSRQADIYSSAIVLWEMLANRPLHADAGFADRIGRLAERPVPPLETYSDVRDPQLDAIVLRALSRDASHRFPTAEAMAVALRHNRAAASSVDIAKWIATTAASDDLEISDERVRFLERLPPAVAFDSTTTGASTPTRRRRAVAAIFWAGGAAVVAVVLFFGVRTIQRGQAPPTTALVAASSPAASDPAPAPSPIAVAAPSAVPSASVAVSAPVKAPPKLPRHAAKSQCDPPYTVDSNGFKHYNRSCF